jgi:hypothetical protein
MFRATGYLTRLHLQMRVLMMAPTQNLSGCFYWAMQLFAYMLLLQPLSSLTTLQCIGLVWGVMIFSHWLAISQMVTRSRVVRLYETAQGECSDEWLVDLSALWVFYSVAMMPVYIMMSIITTPNILLVGWGVVWVIASPVLFLQLYLARVVALLMKHGHLMGFVLVMPWLLAGMLLVMLCFSAITGGGDIVSRVTLLLGCNMLQVLVFYLVIRRAIQVCYWHTMLEYR